MNPDDLKKRMDQKDIYDETREDTLRAMLLSFYSRRMLSTAVLVWINFLFWAAMGIVSMILLFRTTDIRYQLLYAALFICFLQWATLSKIFAWQMIHRHSIQREIKRLEFRLAELQETIRGRPT